MKPGKLDLTIIQGSTYGGTFLVIDPDESAVDLTGYNARLSAKLLIDDTTTVISWISTGLTPQFVMGGAAGTIVLTVDASDTALLNFDQAIYDMEIYDGAGLVYRILEGYIELSKEVTS